MEATPAKPMKKFIQIAAGLGIVIPATLLTAVEANASVIRTSEIKPNSTSTIQTRGKSLDDNLVITRILTVFNAEEQTPANQIAHANVHANYTIPHTDVHSNIHHINSHTNNEYTNYHTNREATSKHSNTPAKRVNQHSNS